VTASATSTFSSALQTTALNVTGTAATSTFARGIDIAGGCFAVNGTCAGGDSHTGTGSAGQVTFWTGASTLSGNNNFFYNNTFGTLGLGTTTPRWNLQIASSTAPQLALSDGSLTSNHWIFRNAGGNLYVATSSASTFATSTVSALSITADGLVGVGTANPLSKFDVKGNVAIGTYAGLSAAPANGLAVSGSVGIGTSSPSRILDVVELNSVAQLRLSKSTTLYSELTLDSVGDLQIGATGGDIRALSENVWICDNAGCPTLTATSTAGNLFVENAVTFGNGFSLNPISATELGLYNASGTQVIIFDNL